MRNFAITLGLVLCATVAATAYATAPAGPSPTPPANTPSSTIPPPSNPTASANPPAAANPAPQLQIMGLALPPGETKTPADQKKEEARQREPKASLGDSIIIETNPNELTAYLDFATKEKKDVTLYLNGKDSGIAPEAIDRAAGTLQFRLERNDGNKTLWSSLLRSPFQSESREVQASVAISGTPAVDGNKSKFTFVVLKKWSWYTWLSLLFLILVIVVFCYFVKEYCILCDTRDGPYSLGRCQMAWWFFLILIAYVVIWLISGDRDTITSSLLGLMGISAATGLGAVMIESTSAGGPPAAAATSHGFLRDILGDSQGNIVLHRFQIAVWTIVLGIIFSVSVVTELTMPEFNANLLTAMGISAGTYLGFKFPEK